MKLELKHLAPYLPYELKLNTPENEMYLIDFKNKKIESLFRGHLINIYEWDEIKPILRPMSDLAKLIQFESEEFIPLVYLYNISNESPHNNELSYEFIDSWGAGKILKVFHYNKLDYTEFVYSEFNFRKDTHHEKGFYTYGMTLPHSISVHSEIKNQYFLHDLLFKWHFDVFGLIDSGLAIDINKVSELLND